MVGLDLATVWALVDAERILLHQELVRHICCCAGRDKVEFHILIKPESIRRIDRVLSQASLSTRWGVMVRSTSKKPLILLNQTSSGLSNPLAFI